MTSAVNGRNPGTTQHYGWYANCPRDLAGICAVGDNRAVSSTDPDWNS